MNAREQVEAKVAIREHNDRQLRNTIYLFFSLRPHRTLQNSPSGKRKSIPIVIVAAWP